MPKFSTFPSRVRGPGPVCPPLRVSYSPTVKTLSPPAHGNATRVGTRQVRVSKEGETSRQPSVPPEACTTFTQGPLGARTSSPIPWVKILRGTGSEEAQSQRCQRQLERRATQSGGPEGWAPKQSTDSKKPPRQQVGKGSWHGCGTRGLQQLQLGPAAGRAP